MQYLKLPMRVYGVGDVFLIDRKVGYNLVKMGTDLLSNEYVDTF